MNTTFAARRVAPLLGLVSAVALVLGGCGESGRFLRRATYPPNFRYISAAELESVMWRLAGRVHELERLAKPPEGEPVDSEAMARVLTFIEREARALEAEGAGSTHPYFDERLDVFLGHVAHARRGLRRTPPVVTSVDDVWQACAGCHDRG